jgi:hypothetical protein
MKRFLCRKCHKRATIDPRAAHALRDRMCVSGGQRHEGLCELSRNELTMIKMFLTVTVSFAPTSQ